MLDVHSYTLFLATALVLVLTPGPDTVLILSRTLASGSSAGVMTLAGTQIGNVIHAVLAGIGVSTVVLLFPVAFTALKILGVVYLLYLAVVAWRAPATLEIESGIKIPSGSFARYFSQGLTNNLSNPKMIVFFVALFPQFVRPKAGSLALQSFLLGATLAVMAMIWIGLLVVLTGHFRAAVARNTAFLKIANRLAAISFFGLACRLAIEERR